MIKYIFERIGAMLLTLFLIMVLSFIVIRLMPMSIFENPEVPLELQKKLEDEMHLHDPIPVQLFYYLKNIIVDFNFGTSVKIKPGAPVFAVVVDGIPPTVCLNLISLFISIPLGLFSGFLAALKRNTWIDNAISFGVVICISVPSFVFASLMQYFLTFVFPVFPTLYDATGSFSVQLYSMVLPIIALALSPIATLARYLRGELIENISSEYLLLARTKGLTRAQATIRHAFRNSMMNLTLLDYARLMMMLSDNSATDYIYGLTGRDNIQKNVIEAFELTKTKCDYPCKKLINTYFDSSHKKAEGNGTWRNTDDYLCLTPENDSTSPADMAKVLKLAYEKKLISPWVSEQMIQIMKLCHTNSRIPKDLPRGVKVAHKTGTLDKLANDCGIVYTEKGDYILCLFYNGNTATQEEYDANFKGRMSDGLLARISKDVYDAYIQE